MTLLEFAELCKFEEYFSEGYQRKGQFLFNWTYKRFPEIANKYNGVECDPFHDDDNIPYFLSTILLNDVEMT